ncbi:MAG: MBL fold metallo-hydrolase [Leptolyngbyaceae cyanobacterium bins.59]|nr:MBL fold metallo-hydrolase [Leptolyngbyaceae cyanobacterium bins.59]
MVDLECLPYAVGNEGEGICVLVRMGPYRILLDCGLEDISPLVADIERGLSLDLILCSHAHPDHAQGLLALHQACPQVPIYASEATIQLLPLNWSEVPSTELPGCHALPWRSPVEFRDGLSAELWPAGHLPGAAAFLLTYTPPASPEASPPRSFTLFYTGDFFLSNSRLVEGMPLEALRGLKPDVLIIEGTYGTARHPRRRQQENQLAERISQALTERQSVLLPAPAIGLAQELLMLLRSHHHFTGRDVDIWVDGAVATACDTYLDLLPHFPSNVQNFAQHQPLFWDERVRPKVRRLPPGNSLSQNPENSVSAIVLTDDQTELSFYCSTDDHWLLLLPQRHIPTVHQEKLARLEEKLQEKASVDPDFTTTVDVETYLLADHCDGAGTTQFIHNLRPQHVVLIHGSPTYLMDLAGLEELQSRYHLHTPSAGTIVELPVGETFLHSPLTTGSYEGELTESATSVTITLPDTIMADPRWQKFADTGLVEIRWQGEELVLRGLSQWEILNPTTDRSSLWSEGIGPSKAHCGTCAYYRSQRCWNEASPLAGFKVPPEGFCPAFKARNKGDLSSI